MLQLKKEKIRMTAQVKSNDGDLAEAWVTERDDNIILTELQIDRTDQKLSRQQFLLAFPLGFEFSFTYSCTRDGDPRGDA